MNIPRSCGHHSCAKPSVFDRKDIIFREKLNIYFDSHWLFPSFSHLPCDRTCASFSCDFVHVICWCTSDKWFKIITSKFLKLFSHKADIRSTPFCMLRETASQLHPASEKSDEQLSVITVIEKVLKKGEKYTLCHTGWLRSNIWHQAQTSLPGHHLATRTHPSSRTPITTVWETVTGFTEIWLSFVET